MARSRRTVDAVVVPRFGFVGFVARRHRRLIVTAVITLVFVAVWLYVRYHHVVLRDGHSPVDCGTWNQPSFEDAGCLGVFGLSYGLWYLVSVVGAGAGALFLVLGLASTLQRPPIAVSGGHVTLRAVGPRDAKALAATIDADVIVENRMPFNYAHTVRNVARWHGMPSHIAICAADTGRIVGAITFAPDVDLTEANLGIWIGSGHRGRGYATDALAAYVPSLHARGFAKVVVETSVDNRAMRAVLEHAGFDSAGNFTFTFPSGEAISAARYVSFAEWLPGAAAARRVESAIH